MMTKHKYKIGLEVHVQIKTKHKLFTGAKNTNLEVPNTSIAYFDIGIPGTFPFINKEAINIGLGFAKFLYCQIPRKLVFDRKHYHYPDLPLGYQLTQFEYPIGIKGEYRISNKKIGILDIHIEADAGKLKDYDNKTHIDYNRCGIPLAEVVTAPDFTCVKEVEEFLDLFINDVKINGFSNARLDKGNLRVDVNISRIIDEEKDITTCRYEIKNLNSIRSVKKAISVAQNILNDKTEKDESLTLSYNEAQNQLTGMRKKEGYAGYFYMYEPALYPICMKNFTSAESFKYTIDSVELITDKVDIDKDLVTKIVCNEETKEIIYQILEKDLEKKQLKTAIAFLGELKRAYSEYPEIEKDKITKYIHEAIELMILKKAVKVNINNAFMELISLDSNDTIKSLLESSDLIIKQVDLDESIVIKLIEEEVGSIQAFKDSNDRTLNFMVGCVMKNIKGVSPSSVKELLIKIKTS